MEEASVRLGAALRRIRETRSMSLSDLARASGVAKATLSALESGGANPTLDTINALSSALHVSMGELLAPSASPLDVVRAGEGHPIRGASVAARLVDQVDLEGGRLEFARGEVGPEGQRSPAHPPGVVEHVFVAAGRARVGPVDRPVLLECGDYLRMDASEPHLYEGVDGPADLILVMMYPKR